MHCMRTRPYPLVVANGITRSLVILQFYKQIQSVFGHRMRWRFRPHAADAACEPGLREVAVQMGQPLILGSFYVGAAMKFLLAITQAIPEFKEKGEIFLGYCVSMKR